jgi:hypothetical protein
MKAPAPMSRARPIFSQDMPSTKAVAEAVDVAMTLLNSASVALSNLGFTGHDEGTAKRFLYDAWSAAYDARRLLKKESAA